MKNCLALAEGISLDQAKKLFNEEVAEFEIEKLDNGAIVRSIIFDESDKNNVVRKDIDASELKEIPAGTISEIEPTITIGDQNTWYLVGEQDYIYIADNSVDKSVSRYFTHLSYVNDKAQHDLPSGVRRRFARATSRYNLPISIIDGFGLKHDSLAHAAYMIDNNEMLIVPTYFTRMGIVKIGSVFIDEFSKTVVHETGHSIWHQILNDEKRAEYVGIAPKFHEQPPPENPGDYRTGYTDTLTGKRVHGDEYTYKNDKFVSSYARMSVKEDFAESFLYYVIAPDFLMGFDKERYEFFNNLAVTQDIDKMAKGSLIIPESQKVVEISDLLPIDLQTSEFRRKLSKEFEAVLSETLDRSQIGLEHVVNLVPFGNYVNAKDSVPEDLSVGIYARDASTAEVISGNIKIALYDTQEALDSLIYSQRVVNSDTKSGPEAEVVEKMFKKIKVKKFKNGDIKINKRYYKKDEIERWVTTPGGRRIPIPKEGVMGREHRKTKKTKEQTRLMNIKSGKKKPPSKKKRTEFPLGHVEHKPTKKQLKLKRPKQSVYSIQMHHSERAPSHRDLRIKVGNRAYSWAIPEWPNKGEKKLAVLQPAHSPEYMKFKGVIRSGYGTGRVDLHDYRGIDITDWTDKKKAFNVYSGPNKGRYALIHVGDKNYLLVRKKNMRKPLKREYTPARPRVKFNEAMWKDPRWLVQPKMNGARYILYTGDKENRLLSRRNSAEDPSRHVEQTDKVPHLRDLKFANKDLVLDGEIFVKDKDTTSAVMNSSAIRARDLQGKYGKPVFYVFDILRYNGNDLRNLPYKTRLKFLERAIKGRYDNVKMVPSFTKNKKSYYKRLVKQGWEGIVLKDKLGKYNDRFMTKMKPVKEDDFVLMDWTPGKGKYEGMFGALILGKYNDRGKLVRVGKVGSGFTEKQRAKLTKLLPNLKRNKSVIAIKHLGVSKKGAPIAPVFDRIRQSKTYHDMLAEVLDPSKEYEGED